MLRVCDDSVFKNRDRPCILYQIKRCSAPCVGHISEKDYKKTVSDAVDFISGKSRKIQENLSHNPYHTFFDISFNGVYSMF